MISPRGFLLATVFAVLAVAAQAAGFIDSLSPEQKKRLGLDQLTPEQQRELTEAIENYRRTGEVTAARQATEEATAAAAVAAEKAVEVATKQAAAEAVAEYKKKEEPGVVARALSIFKSSEPPARADGPDRFTATIPGKFRGWSGRTEFVLDNGQVWRQTTSEVFSMKAQENVAVVLYKAASGYWRLRLLDDTGAWVSVKRVR